jgi:hypothetical protein
MSTAQATAMSFNDYQGYLALVNSSIAGGNWSGAFLALAQARVVLAALPITILTGQQMTRFRMGKDLDNLGEVISSAQIASQTNGAGMGVGLFSITRAR